MVAEKGIPDGGKYVGPPSKRRRSAVRSKDARAGPGKRICVEAASLHGHQNSQQEALGERSGESVKRSLYCKIQVIKP